MNRKFISGSNIALFQAFRSSNPHTKYQSSPKTLLLVLTDIVCSFARHTPDDLLALRSALLVIETILTVLPWANPLACISNLTPGSHSYPSYLCTWEGHLPLDWPLPAPNIPMPQTLLPQSNSACCRRWLRGSEGKRRYSTYSNWIWHIIYFQ